MEGAKTGTKQHFTSAFASMGLIKQIEEIKANGKQQGSEEIDGVRYDKYEYGSLQDGEMVVVVLSSGTSVPRMWLTAVKTGNNTASLVRTIYRDMSVNVDIPDHTFALPADVMFSEQPKNAPKQISHDQ
jgi:hypothetical protein